MNWKEQNTENRIHNHIFIFEWCNFFCEEHEKEIHRQVQCSKYNREHLECVVSDEFRLHDEDKYHESYPKPHITVDFEIEKSDTNSNNKKNLNNGFHIRSS